MYTLSAAEGLLAFISTLGEEWVVTATLIKIEAGQGEFIMRIPVGYDDEDFSIYSAFVSLATEPGWGDMQYELVFSVVVSRPSEDLDFRMDGLETIHLIPNKEDRAKILNAICFATKRLIDEVSPPAVSMATHEPNLPRKALVKYEAISHEFSRAGYHAGRADGMYGLEIWMMSKL